MSELSGLGTSTIRTWPFLFNITIVTDGAMTLTRISTTMGELSTELSLIRRATGDLINWLRKNMGANMKAILIERFLSVLQLIIWLVLIFISVIAHNTELSLQAHLPQVVSSMVSRFISLTWD